ncbi:hypothetical protein [Nonomuraea sp. B19D2]|uniref:hypothetical protein n=1 Tax=Nonomuraea sp. B19D2 TaxID=3159561 RepID=UPI0032DBE7FD
MTALPDYLHRRTSGMIGSLSHLIRGAAIDAILDGSEKMTRAHLDAIRLDHAAEARPADAHRETGTLEGGQGMRPLLRRVEAVGVRVLLSVFGLSCRIPPSAPILVFRWRTFRRPRGQPDGRVL